MVECSKFLLIYFVIGSGHVLPDQKGTLSQAARMLSSHFGYRKDSAKMTLPWKEGTITA